MNSPLQRQKNDLGVHSLAPTRPNDARVRLAEEDRLQADITNWLVSRVKKPSWLTPLALSFGVNNLLQITGIYQSQIYPQEITLNTQIKIPALESEDSVVKRTERLYLVCLGAIVGADQDPELGKISFKYLDKSNPNAPVLAPVQKENAKRDRAFWLLVLSQNVLTPAAFLQSLPTEAVALNQTSRLDGDRTLTIADLSAEGFSSGGMRIYACDPLLALASYPILNAFVEVSEVALIPRIQLYTDQGYTWGFQGEEPLTNQYNLSQIASPIPNDRDAQIRERLINLSSGSGGVRSRTVQNLTAGLVSGNPGRAGSSAAAPNGSVNLASGQRITFTNQAFSESRGAQSVVVQNDGNGNPVITVSLPANAPEGTHFAEKPTDHHLYSTRGVDQINLGQVINTGNALTWIGTANSSLKPGNSCYFAPMVRYPAGSGFTVPFAQVERVWIDGVPIVDANIRNGEANDLSEYEAPAANQEYLVVVGRERAALHYILRKVSLLADANGVLTMPPNSFGCFAFIQGVPGRVDLPIASGLTPNGVYSALVYYPPILIDPVQLQMSYPAYQGTGEGSLLDGAIVISKAYLFINSQGGGNSVFQGDGRIRYSPISMHLPQVDSGLQSYELDAPLQLLGEPYSGAVSFREISLLSGSGLALPNPGMLLQLVSNTGLGSGKSLVASLKSNGQTLGLRSPILAGRKPFQTILAFAIRKGEEERLVVATHNGSGNENIALDSSLDTAFDTFKL